jgi:hypothetical protein
VKASSLISTALLALSLAGAAQAQPAAPAASNIAPAIIELAPCDTNSPAPCDISGAVAAKAGETDLHALPPADPKQQQNATPVTPVPEPHTFVMLMLGLVVLGFAARRGEPTEKFKD